MYSNDSSIYLTKIECCKILITLNKKLKSLQSIPEWYSKYNEQFILSLKYAFKDRIAKVQIAANQAMKYFDSDLIENEEIHEKGMIKMNKLNLLRNLSKLNKDKSEFFSVKNLKDEIYNKGIDSLLKTTNFLRSRGNSAIKLSKNKTKFKINDSTSLLTSFRNDKRKNLISTTTSKDFNVLYEGNDRLDKIVEEIKNSHDEVEKNDFIFDNKETLYIEDEREEVETINDEKENNIRQIDHEEEKPIIEIKEFDNEINNKTSRFPLFYEEENIGTELVNNNEPVEEYKQDTNKIKKKKKILSKCKKEIFEIVYLESFSYIDYPSIQKAAVIKDEEEQIKPISPKTIINNEIKRVVDFSFSNNNSNFMAKLIQLVSELAKDLEHKTKIFVSNIEKKINSMEGKIKIIQSKLNDHLTGKENPIIEESLNLSEISHKKSFLNKEINDHKESINLTIVKTDNRELININDKSKEIDNNLVMDWANIMNELENNNKTKAINDALFLEDDIILLRVLFLTGPCLDEIDINVALKLIKRISRISRCHMIQNLIFLIIKKSVQIKLFDSLDDKEKNEILESLCEFSLLNTQEYGRQSCVLYKFILSR